MQKFCKYDLTKIELAKAKLDEYAYALKTVEGDSFSEQEIRAFFDGENHNCIKCGNQSPYQHNKLQWVMESYFNDLGFKKVKDVSYGYLQAMPPKKQDIEYEPKKYFQGYREAVVFYERQLPESDTIEKLVVDISENYNNSGMSYSIFHNSSIESIFVKWLEIADQKNFYKGKKINISGEFLNLSEIGWDDVILSDEKKQIVRASIADIFGHSDDMKKFGISIQRGIILHGSPGTGKTQICRALAKESNCSVVYALPTDFQKGNMGVRLVTDMAKDLAPCILIIEDMDWIALDRDAGRAGFVTELMNQMDGIESFGDIVTVGTTNRKDELEDAVKNRPGRFDRIISIDNPELPERIGMINSFCKSWDISKINVEKIAKGLDGLSGAHIKELCKTAAIHAVCEKSISKNGKKLIINNGHFAKAWAEVKDKDVSSYLETKSRNKKTGSFGFAGGSLADDDGWMDDL